MASLPDQHSAPTRRDGLTYPFGGAEPATGEVMEVANEMETRTIREPLGVTALICPFSMSTKLFIQLR